MIDYLIKLDQQLFFFLNGFHNSTIDFIMYWISQKEVWFPLYLTIIIWLVKEYKWKAILWVIGIVAAVGLSDFIISGLMKPFFERLRPSRDPAFEGMVHIVNGYTGGRFGFASSHAGTTAALATFVYLLFRNRYKWIWVIFFYAILSAYSRIYLGVHYPGDIFVGAFIGVLLGVIFYKLSIIIKDKYLSKTLPSQ